MYRNTSSEPIVFRDDRPDKQRVQPGATFTVVGDQHVPMVEAIYGVQHAAEPEPLAADATVTDLRARAAELGLRLRSGMSRADIEEAIRALSPATIAEPEAAP